MLTDHAQISPCSREAFDRYPDCNCHLFRICSRGKKSVRLNCYTSNELVVSEKAIEWFLVLGGVP